MKNEKMNGKKLLKAAVNAMLDKDTREWPPVCLGFIYQPVRPEKAVNKEGKER